MSKSVTTLLKQVFSSALLLGVGLFLTLALISHSGNDNGWTTATTDTHSISNLMGASGAWFADVLFAFFGLAAWLIPLIFFYEILNVWILKNQTDLKFRFAGVVFCWFALATLFSLLFENPAETSFMHAGGIIGHEAAAGLLAVVGHIPSLLFAALFSLLTFTFSFGINWQRLWQTIQEALSAPTIILEPPALALANASPQLPKDMTMYVPPKKTATTKAALTESHISEQTQAQTDTDYANASINAEPPRSRTSTNVDITTNLKTAMPKLFDFKGDDNTLTETSTAQAVVNAANETGNNTHNNTDNNAYAVQPAISPAQHGSNPINHAAAKTEEIEKLDDMPVLQTPSTNRIEPTLGFDIHKHTPTTPTTNAAHTPAAPTSTALPTNTMPNRMETAGSTSTFIDFTQEDFTQEDFSQDSFTQEHFQQEDIHAGINHTAAANPASSLHTGNLHTSNAQNNHTQSSDAQVNDADNLEILLNATQEIQAVTPSQLADSTDTPAHSSNTNTPTLANPLVTQTQLTSTTGMTTLEQLDAINQSQLAAADQSAIHEPLATPKPLTTHEQVTASTLPQPTPRTQPNQPITESTEKLKIPAAMPFAVASTEASTPLAGQSPAATKPAPIDSSALSNNSLSNNALSNSSLNEYAAARAKLANQSGAATPAAETFATKAIATTETPVATQQTERLQQAQPVRQAPQTPQAQIPVQPSAVQPPTVQPPAAQSATTQPKAVPPDQDYFSEKTGSRAMAAAAHRASLSPLPSIELLEKPDPLRQPSYSPEELARLAKLLEIKLGEFNVKAKVANAQLGPVVTRFEVELSAGVKVSKVTGIARDLARSLSMASVRVVEVIPGKPYIGIEVPNQTREMVRLHELLTTKAYQNPKAGLSMAIGKDIGGKPVITDLAKAPHMLVAGTTGSGKSVAVNCMLLSLLLKYKPEELRLILIDPKQLELANYNDIPHLLTQVVTDMKDAASALNWCVAEMERRYKLMAFLKVRKLSDYNKKIQEAEATGEDFLDPLWRPNDDVSTDRPPRLKPLPAVVVVADEFADMIMQVGKQAEELITRLAQKSRAAGIHLILATQRPSVDVITGLIKANIPTRVALRVNSKVDSRTILDSGGAEDMLGNGDMLFLGPGQIEPSRAHGAYISDDEVNTICDAWRERGSPDYVEDMFDSFDLDGGSSSDSSGASIKTGEQDALYDEAVAFIMETRKVSASSIQRKFSIGYNRAARIVDAMEDAGLISSMGKSGKREILM